MFRRRLADNDFRRGASSSESGTSSVSSLDTSRDRSRDKSSGMNSPNDGRQRVAGRWLLSGDVDDLSAESEGLVKGFC